MTAIANRYEIVYLVDVTNGNPNGDPDAGNMPRIDPETSLGLMSDVCIKRKVRNYVGMSRPGTPGHGIYVGEGSILNERHREAYVAVRGNSGDVRDAKALSPKGDDEARRIAEFMCANFFDVRAFGAVMGTKINAGQVRGPVQFAFGRSVDPILPLEVTITRMAATKEADEGDRKKKAKGGEEAEPGDARSENRTMGRKHIVPYGLYRIHGYVSPHLAAKTGFGEADLELLWEALGGMLDHDRSAARGEMAARRLVVFRHGSALGNARASDLFDSVKIRRAGAPDLPPRRYGDYEVVVDRAAVPDGVEVLDLI